MQKCLAGEMDQDLAFAISDEELEKGYRLICIGSPLSIVVLDTYTSSKSKLACVLSCDTT